MPAALKKARATIKSFQDLPAPAPETLIDAVKRREAQKLVDELGEIMMILAPMQEKIRRKEEIEKNLRETFGELKVPTITGKLFAVDAKFTPQRRLDNAKVNQYLLSMGKLESFKKTIMCCSLFVRRKNA